MTSASQDAHQTLWGASRFEQKLLAFKMESANFMTQDTSNPLNARFATTRTVTQLYPWNSLRIHIPSSNPARSTMTQKLS